MADSNGASVEDAGKKEEVAVAEKLTDLDNNINRQIEYYFGDINLPRDKFLKEQVLLDDGWVPISTLLKFNRLNCFTKESDIIVAALEKSEKQLIEVSDDKQKVRRTPNIPLPELNEERRKELMSRTIYAKGFPKDAVIDDCLTFFKQYNNPEDILMRKYQDRPTKTWHFKGSVFVTFKVKEHAESFLKEESVKFKDVELEREWQESYIEKKQAKAELKQKGAKKGKQQEEARNVIKLPTGTVLLLTDVPESVNRDNIKETVTALGGEVGFVKLEDGKAWIRLQKEDTAKGVFEKCTDSKMSVDGVDIQCAVLEGDEENKFLTEMADELVKRRQKQTRNKGGGRQNYGRKRKGGGGGDHGPHSKRNK